MLRMFMGALHDDIIKSDELKQAVAACVKEARDQNDEWKSTVVAEMVKHGAYELSFVVSAINTQLDMGWVAVVGSDGMNPNNYKVVGSVAVNERLGEGWRTIREAFGPIYTDDCASTVAGYRQLVRDAIASQ